MHAKGGADGIVGTQDRGDGHGLHGMGGGEPGGGIFALRRPRPYSGAIARRLQGLPPAIIIYAHADINRNGERGDNDAARRVATSFEKRENRF